MERYQTEPIMPSSPPPTTHAGPRCATHPDREAARDCARCGALVCEGCLVGEDLCADCKRRLLREGTPWTPSERARSSARKLRRVAEAAVRLELGVAAAGVVVTAGAAGGSLPAFLRPVGLGLWGAAAAAGLLALGCAALGARRSEQGRPGPAVSGVFRLPQAAFLGVLGAVPAALSLGWLWTR